MGQGTVSRPGQNYATPQVGAPPRLEPNHIEHSLREQIPEHHQADDGQQHSHGDTQRPLGENQSLIATKPPQRQPVGNPRQHGGNYAQDDKGSAEPYGALVQMDGFWSGGFLSQGSEESDCAKAKRGHCQRGSDPGQGGSVKCELRSELRHARAVTRQFHVCGTCCLLIHGLLLPSSNGGMNYEQKSINYTSSSQEFITPPSFTDRRLSRCHLAFLMEVGDHDACAC